MVRPGAADRLLRALSARLADQHEVAVVAESISSESWASITFSGERHRLRLGVAGPHAEAAVEALIAGLPEFEPDMPGQLLVDIALAGRSTAADGRMIVDLTAVTLERDSS